MNSRLAPPPVDTCVYLSFHGSMASSVSPPPIMTTFLLFARYSAISFVPWANFSTSKYPNGPFQNIVFALLIWSLNNWMDSCPISRPNHSSGMSNSGTTMVSESLSLLLATTISSGNIIFSLLRSIFASAMKFSSYRLFPTPSPFALYIVNTIAPPKSI